jgi:hypothetical protein
MLLKPESKLFPPVVPEELQLKSESTQELAHSPVPILSGGHAIEVPLQMLNVHSSLAKRNLQPSEACLLSLETRNPNLTGSRVLITDDNVIVGGFDVYYLALRKGMTVIRCYRLSLVGDEALEYIIRNHTSGAHLNAFVRIELAADLWKSSSVNAKANQSTGGRLKALSTLTDDQRIDRRRQVALLTGASTGSVGKVSYLLKNADSALQKLLRADKIRIHPAWKLARESPGDQKVLLAAYLKAGRRRRSPYRTALQTSKEPGSFGELRAFDTALRDLSSIPAYLAFCQTVTVMLANQASVPGHKGDQNA